MRNTYEELYSALLKLCKNEGLQLREEDLGNAKAIATLREDCVVLNTGYKGKGGSKGLTDFYNLISNAVNNK